MNKNLLIATDSYKLGHMTLYPEGTTKVYSYLIARSDKKCKETVFYGLQALIKEYLSQKITQEMVDEALMYRAMILGSNSDEVVSKYNSLAKLGYLPLEIKAVPEGTVMPVKNVLLTITNTHPDFAWVVGYVESMLLKVWNTTTVASYSRKLRQLVEGYADATCDNNFHCDWQVHDFGYRGCSSEETAALSGSAHLLNFYGTDTVPAVKLLKEFYNGDGLIGASVPASEHSVMCAYGENNELDAFKSILKKNPTGIVSIVSDTYNLWNVLTNYAGQLKEEILARDGKVVFRPDSGDPELIICGNPKAKAGTPENKGCIRLLEEMFGSTTNAKGFKVLNPKVGLIYGDGMYFERFERILNNLKEMGYATSNLVVGIGGLLLQQHSRDDMGFAIKATYCVVNGEEREIVKNPITDSGKKSHKGLLALARKSNGDYVTLDRCDEAAESCTLLQTIFKDGKLYNETSLAEIRNRLKESL